MTEFVSVQGNTAVEDDRETIYPKYKDLLEAGVPEEGLVIAEGIYTGSFDGEGKFGPFTTYYVDAGDKKIGLNKAGNLGYLINKAELTPNVSKIQVVYFGKQPMKSGERAGTLAHTFDVRLAQS